MVTQQPCCHVPTCKVHTAFAEHHIVASFLRMLFRALLHNQLELAATEASLAFIKSTLDELGKTRTAKQAAHDQLIAKHKKIEDFQTLSVSSKCFLFV